MFFCEQYCNVAIILMCKLLLEIRNSFDNRTSLFRKVAIYKYVYSINLIINATSP